MKKALQMQSFVSFSIMITIRNDEKINPYINSKNHRILKIKDVEG